MEKLLHQFFQKQQVKGPFLLALSGGPDSSCLFHALLSTEYAFHVAHVDHGWRTESREEALLLQEQCRQYDIPFYTQRLEAPLQPGNWEEKGRNARLIFFRHLCQEHQLEAVLLGHHADDQAETVLKRVLEGASLLQLKGLLPRKQMGSLLLLRPFLTVSKREILDWLQTHHISYFLDPTNTDPRFLRGRLRGQILPWLSTHFGKEVATNLGRLGQAAAEWETCVEEWILPYRQRVTEYEGRRRLDLSYDPPPHPFLWKEVLRDFFRRGQMTLSRPFLEGVIAHIKNKNLHKKLIWRHYTLLCHRGVLEVYVDNK